MANGAKFRDEECSEEGGGGVGGENARMRSVLRAVHEDGGSTMLFSLYV